MKPIILCIALFLPVRGRKEDSTFEENVVYSGKDAEMKRKNEILLQKYNQILPELLPENFSMDQGNSDKKLLKLIKTMKKRKRFFKATCGRKHSIIEKYLATQLNNFQRKLTKLYLNNCTKKAVNRNDGMCTCHFL